MKIKLKCIIGVLFIVTLSQAVSLENWRLPFYRIASERGEFLGSPSNMFWDNCKGAQLFDSSLWPDTATDSEYQWILEPALFATLSNEEFISGKKSNFHFDFFSNFTWKRLTVRTLLDVDQSNKSDPGYVWKKDRIAAGLIEEAYLQYDGKYGFVRLGRMKRNWGPFIERSILLSNNPFAYDAFEWQVALPFLEFRHLFSAFPRYFSHIDTDNYAQKLDRYFIAHALNFIFGGWGSLGVSETVLFSRENGFPDLQYINPFSIYSVLNTNFEGNANLMLGFQGWVHPFTKKIQVKAQIVFDDFQVDDETIYDKEPMHWAGDFGIYARDFLPIKLAHHVALEYRYLSKWMYTVTPRNTAVGERYTYLGRSLGYPDIDGDNFRFALTAVGKNYWAATLGMNINRKDTCTVKTSWPNDPLGYRDEEKLSKRSHLTTTISNFIEAHGYFRDFCAAHLTIENRWINHRNIDDSYTYDPRITLTISAHYCDFFLPFRKKSSTTKGK